MKGKIYKITNSINNKIYIGQTTEATLDRRYKNHLYASHCFKPKSSLYRAIQKYGEDAFSIELIEEVEIELLNEREMFYIKHFNSFSGGYNDTLGGSGVSINTLDNDVVVEKYREFKHMGKTIEFFNSTYYIISKILKNNDIEIVSPTREDNRIRVYDDKLGIWFESILDCAKYFIDNKITSATEIRSVSIIICNSIKNKTPFHGHILVTSKDDIEKCSMKVLKSVKQIDKNGVIVTEFNSMSEAERKTGINQKAISNCCRGKQKTSGGFIWEYC